MTDDMSWILWQLSVYLLLRIKTAQSYCIHHIIMSVRFSGKRSKRVVM